MNEYISIGVIDYKDYAQSDLDETNCVSYYSFG